MDKLNEKDLGKVSGGSAESNLKADVLNELSKAGSSLTGAIALFERAGNIADRDKCRQAVSIILEACHFTDEGIPWNVIRKDINDALDIIFGINSLEVEKARESLNNCNELISKYYCF